MSRSDAEVWPWMLAAGVVGGGVLVALALCTMPLCTIGMLNPSWSNTLPSMPSSGASVYDWSAPRNVMVAAGGRSPLNGASRKISCSAVVWSSPFGRNRYTIRLYAPHGWKFGNSV